MTMQVPLSIGMATNKNNDALNTICWLNWLLLAKYI